MARARLPRRRARAAALLLAPVLALGLAACDGGGEDAADEPAGDTGSSDTGGTGSGEDPADAASDSEPGNAADVAFLQAMSVHHQQALAMTELAADRPLQPQTQELVDAIAEAQGAELEEMTALLEAWGEDVPKGVGGMSGTGGMEGMEMDGMVSARTLRQLDQAPDAAFEGLWLAIMQQHHEGAVAMARTVLAEGDSEAVQDLADRVVAEQGAELETIGRLLDGGV